MAAFDADGDGKADVVTATGPGAAPHVRVLKGTNLSPITQFYAFDPTFLGGVFVG